MGMEIAPKSRPQGRKKSKEALRQQDFESKKRIAEVEIAQEMANRTQILEESNDLMLFSTKLDDDA